MLDDDKTIRQFTLDARDRDLLCAALTLWDTNLQGKTHAFATLSHKAAADFTRRRISELIAKLQDVDYPQVGHPT